MNFTCLVLTTLFSLQAAVAAPDDAFHRAVGELAAGHADAGYHLLEQVSLEDSYFVESLVEMQKIHYRRQDWQKFFAYAMFYRKKIVAETATLSPRMISLEVMALSKHCRLKEAQTIGTGALIFGHEHGIDVSEIENTLVHLHLSGAYPKALAGKEHTSRPAPVLSRELYWKVPSDDVRLISNPRDLRAIVSSRCAK